MIARNSQYIVGAIMWAFAIFQITRPDYWEFALYATAGSAFITMGLIRNKVFDGQNKFVTLLSWVLILAAVFIFLFMVRTDG